MEICQQILEQIKKYDTIIIHRHMRADPDALGSQVGLKELLQYNFPEKKIKVVGYDLPTLTWLATMDQVENDEFEGSLAIVCDTANTARIDDKRYLKAETIIKIDHHPNDEEYGDLVWIDTSSSSASEMIAIFAEENNLELSDNAAYLLTAGIIGDTGRFLYPSTSARTLRIASHLRAFDFDYAGLTRKMDTISYKIAKLQGYIYDHLEVDENGVARVLLSQEVLKQFNVTDAETAAIVGAPGRIDSVSLWGIFVEQTDGHYRVRLRSKIHPINEIAKEHDGGGHPLASGANSYSLEENEIIYQKLKNLLKN
ncbi:DHH family protein [Streptococcus oralis subsp. tigurinus]|uniref:DHH family protein n=1 Tax=Streptococcus oralis subsp. tigurinus TaxID=1077464 RepID=A0A224A6A5_STROR|nr:bifunctional oligoribonuclease/PAP phosphatase NrnA [Streptococcus oralis]BBA08803.1 DHH family protein [Streptococcus oralis subsp. tigurinus]